MSDLTFVACGHKADHKCNSDSPEIYGGDDVPTVTERPLSAKGYTWGSVSCSICGLTAMEESMRRDWK